MAIKVARLSSSSRILEIGSGPGTAQLPLRKSAAAWFALSLIQIFVSWQELIANPIHR
jgi:tRNA1(Val) A37 N6-methylase TrmN6